MNKNKLVSPKVYESVVIPGPIEEVWDVIRDFNSMPKWHPAIAESEIVKGTGVGSVRRLILEDKSNIEEKLLALSDTDCKYTYSILKSPMPMENYIATLSLSEITATNQTFAEWYSNFDVKDLSEEKNTINTVRDVYKSGLGNLADIFS